MLGNLTGWHFLIILAIVLLLFGATKLPALAKSVGQSMKVFRSEMKSDDVPAVDAPEADATAETVEPASTKQ
jgi:sec-independent protein translocase protein TatA